MLWVLKRTVFDVAVLLSIQNMFKLMGKKIKDILLSKLTQAFKQALHFPFFLFAPTFPYFFMKMPHYPYFVTLKCHLHIKIQKNFQEARCKTYQNF